MNSTVTPLPTATSDQAERKSWMAAMAHAPADRLAALWEAVSDKPDFQYLRAPEIGMVMSQGRVGGTGNAFHLAEVTVTRCSVRLSNGLVGHAYHAGRDKKKAEIAAVMDALLQDATRAQDLIARVITPLVQERAARDEVRASKVAATRVDFYTMVRGED